MTQIAGEATPTAPLLAQLANVAQTLKQTMETTKNGIDMLEGALVAPTPPEVAEEKRDLASDIDPVHNLEALVSYLEGVSVQAERNAQRLHTLGNQVVA